MTPIAVIGWLGTATYLLAYALLAGGIIGSGRLYYAMNGAAALAVSAVAASTATWQSVTVNLLWAAISVYGYFALPLPVGWVAPRWARGTVAMLICGGLLGIVAAVFHEPLFHAGVTVLGWGAVAAFLCGYALFVARKIDRAAFHGFNLAAAAAILPQLWVHGNWPVLVLEVCWGLAAAVGLGREWWRGEA